jgi:hypothetical protein
MLLLSSKEESKWLPEKLPGVEELIFHLTRLNDNVMVYVKRIYKDDGNGDKIYVMSNGLSYKKGLDGRWSVV